jgi:hypothetical protein
MFAWRPLAGCFIVVSGCRFEVLVRPEHRRRQFAVGLRSHRVQAVVGRHQRDVDGGPVRLLDGDAFASPREQPRHPQQHVGQLGGRSQLGRFRYRCVWQRPEGAQLTLHTQSHPAQSQSRRAENLRSLLPARDANS